MVKQFWFRSVPTPHPTDRSIRPRTPDIIYMTYYIYRYIYICILLAIVSNMLDRLLTRIIHHILEETLITEGQWNVISSAGEPEHF